VQSNKRVMFVVLGCRLSRAFRFLVALARCGDLLLSAKHLFVAAIGPCTPMGRATGSQR
jgi:hypothetical protein